MCVIQDVTCDLREKRCYNFTFFLILQNILFLFKRNKNLALCLQYDLLLFF